MQCQPDSVVRLGDDHTAGVVAGLSQPASRHCGLHRGGGHRVLAVAKVPLPRWYWIGLAVGILVGVAFVHWLIFQSLYRIGALCPYCMVVWAVIATLLVVVASIVFGPMRKTGKPGASGHGCSINGDGRWPRSGSRQYSC